jgi:hypothetical protein
MATLPYSSLERDHFKNYVSAIDCMLEVKVVFRMSMIG